MRLSQMVLLIPLGIAGCVSLTSSPQPASQTIIVPPPLALASACTDGFRPPCP